MHANIKVIIPKLYLTYPSLFSTLMPVPDSFVYSVQDSPKQIILNYDKTISKIMKKGTDQATQSGQEVNQINSLNLRDLNYIIEDSKLNLSCLFFSLQNIVIQLELQIKKIIIQTKLNNKHYKNAWFLFSSSSEVNLTVSHIYGSI